MDFVYMAGFVVVSTVFAAFAMTTDPNKHPILRNMFFLAALASLFLTTNMSVQAAKTGDWVVNSTVLDAATNTTAYTYVQKAPAFNAPDLDNIYLILSTVLWLVFAYVVIQLLLNALEWVLASFKKGGDD